MLVWKLLIEIMLGLLSVRMLLIVMLVLGNA